MSIKIEGEGSKENVFSDSDSGMPLWNGAPSFKSCLSSRQYLLE